MTPTAHSSRRSRLATRLARLAAVATLLASMAACSQLDLLRLYYANDHTEARLDAPLPITLPFRTERGWVIVAGRVNGGEPIDFVLDTGAGMLSVLTSTATDHLGFDVSQMRRLGPDDDLGVPTAAPQRDVDVALGPLTLVGQTLLAIPLSTLACRPTASPPFQGVLGYELFHRYVVEFDYDRGVVVLHDPQQYVPAEDAQLVALDIRGKQAYARATVEPSPGLRHDLLLHVDSGADIELSLFPRTDPAIVVPEGEDATACLVGGTATYRRGPPVSVRLGDGASSLAPALYATGAESMNHENGRVGARFLQRFNVAFDYPGARMFLRSRDPLTSSAAIDDNRLPGT